MTNELLQLRRSDRIDISATDGLIMACTLACTWCILSNT